MSEHARGALYPVLPLRDIVVFPHMIVPLFVGRQKSVRALEDVMKDDKQILLVTQKNAAQDDPSTADIFTVGTVGTVLQLLKLPDGTVKVLVEGRHRARIQRFADNEQFFQAFADAIGERAGAQQETEALAERLEKVFGYMEGEIGVLQVEKRIRNRVKRQMEKTQREYYLNEQLK